MVLAGVREQDGWLTSRWYLTYPAAWDKICKGVSAGFDTFEQPEVLLDGTLLPSADKDAISGLEESANLTVRGFSRLIGVPIMLTFQNQTQNVDVVLAPMIEEFKETNYEKFNLSLGSFMDSIELSMYLN